MIKPPLPLTESPQKDGLHLFKRAYPFVGIILFFAALLVLKRSASSFRIQDVLRFIDELPVKRGFGAVALVIVNFFLFAGYDLLALRYIGKRLPLGKVSFTAMLSFAFSNVVGGMVLAGGSIRYRSYSTAGLSAVDILRITTFIWVSWLLGMAALDGVALSAYPHLLDGLHGGRLPGLIGVGVALCLAVAAYLALVAKGQRELVVHSLRLPLPSLGISIGQVGVVVVDMLLSSAILYLLMPELPAVGFAKFAAYFAVATTLALFSGIPGGLGVFEVLMLHLLKSDLVAHEILGALVVFRLLYYILPLAGAAGVLGFGEAVRLVKPLKPLGDVASGWAVRVIPQIFSLSVLVAGLVLLVTGTLPSSGLTLRWVSHVFPLNLFEMSHFGASIVGILLVLFSHELRRKQHGAYVAVLVLLLLGVVMEVVKGHAWVSIVTLGGLFLALLPCRAVFTRHSALLKEPLSLQSLAALLAIAGSSVWLVFFNYRHVQYANELWWKFSLEGNASRALRATAVAMIVLLVFSVRKLLRAPIPEPHCPVEGELDELRQLVGTAANASAALALLCDKTILFSPDRRSFIMYGVANRVWVAMGDPVGAEENFAELIWTFRDQCDRHGARPVFYQVSEESLALYADAGFSFFKLGEEAIVPLSGFTLEGPEQREMRYIHRKVEKQGCTFEVLPKEAVAEAIPRLKEISNAWMGSKGGKEKSFSLGRFDETYLSNFPVGIVRDIKGNIIAFANLWCGGQGRELSIDLMRYLPDSPNGIMDYLFISLFLWGHDQGFVEFNMGMAPLAGLEDHPLSPLWTRIGVWIFRHGEHFYNFKGLRNYKAKFTPQWRPRYLASMGNTQLPNELLSVTMLIAGGFPNPLKRGKDG
jgi:phosphatidylglycerol lysyltransferase